MAVGTTATTFHIALYHGPIGGGQVERLQVRQSHPANGRVFVRVRWAALTGKAADVRQHFDHDRAIIMRESRQRSLHDYIAGEFLLDFPRQRMLWSFSGLYLAAGEFPLSAEVFMRWPLRNQQAAKRIHDNRANDGDGSA